MVPSDRQVKDGTCRSVSASWLALALLLAIVVSSLENWSTDSGSHKQTQTKLRGPQVYAMSPHLQTFEKVAFEKKPSQGFSQPPPGASLPLLSCPVLHLVTDEHGRSQSLHLL